MYQTTPTPHLFVPSISTLSFRRTIKLFQTNCGEICSLVRIPLHNHFKFLLHKFWHISYSWGWPCHRTQDICLGKRISSQYCRPRRYKPFPVPHSCLPPASLSCTNQLPTHIWKPQTDCYFSLDCPPCFHLPLSRRGWADCAMATSNALSGCSPPISYV